MSKQSAALLAFILLIQSCSDFAAQPAPTPVRQKISAATPADLRMIPSEQLKMEIQINDADAISYNGSDFPDDTWFFDVDLIPDKSNKLNVNWFDGDLLLVSESAIVFADSSNRKIRPDFDFVTSGSMQFDRDCDGQSNLEERYSGSDPYTAEPGSGSSNACEVAFPQTVLENEENLLASLSQTNSDFSEDGLLARLFKVEQAVQVRNINPDESSNYTFLLNNDAVDGSRLTLSFTLRADTNTGRFLWFRANDALDMSPSGFTDSSCVVNDDTAVFVCTTPFRWKEKQWYTLMLEEISPDRWEASITDQDTGVRVSAGFVSVENKSRWSRTFMNMNYTRRLSIDECMDGLIPITMHYKSAVLNSTVTQTFGRFFGSECIEYGGGKNYSSRYFGDELFHSQTLGRI